ncbi:hypothetical protein KSP40_PGU008956 [Platanthera guangdongensis]|uniref:Uncharacterized protein n=1 Tax=Platanthera guangdongensis TaxID=2320717 RepID=A0ABR2LPM8_9ASPA
MHCVDKFLLQSTKVSPTIDIDEIPPDTSSTDADLTSRDAANSCASSSVVKILCSSLCLGSSLCSQMLDQVTELLPNVDLGEIPDYYLLCGCKQFSKHGEKVIEECKLKVVYFYPQSGNTNSEGESGISSTSKHSGKDFDVTSNANYNIGHPSIWWDVC